MIELWRTIKKNMKLVTYHFNGFPFLSCKVSHQQTSRKDTRCILTRIVCANKLATNGCSRGGNGSCAAARGSVSDCAARTRASSCSGATTRHTRAVATAPPHATNSRRAAWPHVSAVTRACGRVPPRLIGSCSYVGPRVDRSRRQLHSQGLEDP